MPFLSDSDLKKMPNIKKVPEEDYGPILNPDMEHLPCAIVVDVSGSMSRCMDELRDGLRIMKETLLKSDACCNVVDTTIILYSEHARVADPFKSCTEMVIPDVEPETTTSLYEAVELALNEIQARKQQYRDAGTTYTRGWIFLFTDGCPTDENENKERVLRYLTERVRQHSVILYPFAIGDNCDEMKLAELSAAGIPVDPRLGQKSGTILKVSPENFAECFVWITDAIETASVHLGEEEAGLLPPELPVVPIPMPID